MVFLIILLQDVCSCLPFLKCPLVLTDCGHPVHITMPDRIVKSGNNLFFPAKEVWPGQICCDRMVCDERTVTVQVLNEELQFFQHFFLCERIKLTTLCFLQQRCPREQRIGLH